MKLTVSKEFTWDCAHMLSDHSGLCANVHGHTYKMQVEVSHVGSAPTYRDGTNEGMVVDFKDLKNIVNKRIVDKMDHAYIAWRHGNAKELKVTKLLEELGMKLYYMEDRPTAENMAKHFFAAIKHGLKDTPIALVSVTVWETPTSFAKFGV